ncbi:MAG TPA: hypothetical protein VGL20_01405 [Candidatus Dormibacteraeota bacterium]|jgi:hypothetical protein
MRRWRRTAAPLALAALLSALPLSSTAVGFGLAQAVPVAAATVQPMHAGHHGSPAARHADLFDWGGDGERDHRGHGCRHGGLVPLVVRLLFGVDDRC